MVFGINKKRKRMETLEDLLENNPLNQKFLKENIDKIVKDLSKQFKEAEDCYRELIQNSIDAETKQIDVNFDVEKIDDTYSKFTVTFQDYGCGMDFHDRDEFFLKLFKSKKENDKKKIGKYGIGISSIFALGLEDVLVESVGTSEKTGKKEKWGLSIKDIQDDIKHQFYDIEESKGTKVSITRLVESEYLEFHKSKVFEKVAYYCERSRTPIYIEGKFMNKEFDMTSDVKFAQSKNDIEYVMSVGEEHTFFELFNNRLKLTEGKLLMSDLDGVSYIISSPYFKHTFSRDDVERDKSYRKVLDEVFKGTTNLFVKSLESIDFKIKNPPDSQVLIYPSLKVDYMRRGLKSFSSEDQIKKIEFELELEKSQLELRKKEDLELGESIEYVSGILFKESVSEIESKIEEFRKAKDAHYEQSKKMREESIKYSREMRGAFEFVNNYLVRRISWVKDNIKGKCIKGIGAEKRVANSGLFYEQLKRSLPSSISSSKIFQTTEGLISLSEVLDILGKDGKLYYLNSRCEVLEDLLKKDDKTIILSSNQFMGGTMLINSLRDNVLSTLASYENLSEMASKRYINAENVYSLPLRIGEDGLNNSTIAFLQDLHKSLPYGIKSRISDIYFTDDEKSQKLGQMPVIYRSESGKTDLTKPHRTFSQKSKDCFKKGITGMLANKQCEVALNIDNTSIRHAIFLYNTNPNLMKKSLKMVKNMVLDSFPRVERIIYNPPNQNRAMSPYRY